MRLHRVRLRNYRGVIESDVSFSTSGVTIVEGQNEVGKTSIAEALQLAIDFPDSSQRAQVKSVKPAGRDEGPQVEIELSSGQYEIVYRKQWLRNPGTTLELRSSRSESLTGREAHDRLKAILAETLDEDLWRALRIEQGTELTLPLFDLPSVGRALDRAAGGDLATDREDSLWNRIGEEYERYWTPSGQAKADRKASERAIKDARNEARELEGRLDGIERDATELTRLLSEETRLATTRTEYKQREFELTKRWESAQRLRNEVESMTAAHATAEAEYARAASEEHRRRELIDALSSLHKALANLEAKAEQAAPALALANRYSEKARADVEDALAVLRSAERKQSLANRDRDYRRQQIELAQLEERHVRYLAAAKALRRAEDFLDSAKVDDDLAGQIERAYLEDVGAKAAADSAAALVEMTALRDITVHVEGEQVALASGESIPTRVDDEAVFVIPGVASMRVKAGPESRDLADRRSKAEEVLRRLCDQGGVADLAEARTAAQQRRDEQRNRADAIEAIKRDLRDLRPEVLANKIDGLSKRVASYPQERPEDPPLPSDFEDAKRVADEMDRLVVERVAEHRTCEDAAKVASNALREAQKSEAVLAARIDDARTSRGDAASRLATARQDRSDEALTGALVVAQQHVATSRLSLEEAKAELSSADPDSLEALLENAREATERATEALQSNKERRNKLRIRLEFVGEEGLHTLHDEARNRLEHVEHEHTRREERAEAARLLKGTFEKRRKQARQRYVEPFKARIDQLGRIVFGPRFAVELDDELQLVRRTLNGITLDIDQLSTGAREQLGVLSRLACAAIVSPDDGGAPVMIDDALGWSDPQRLQNMGAAIAAAGKQCQVVVLTCTPGRYSHVGNAKVITLGT